MKVAILHSGDTKNMKGVMNFVNEKAFRLQHYGQNDLQVDVFCVRKTYTRLFTWLILKEKYKPNREHLYIEKINGVQYNYIWTKYGLYDSFVSNKLFKHLISWRYYNLFKQKLKGYDIITTHNLDCHQMALKLSKNCSLPIVCTWHGSDIHTQPFIKKGFKVITKSVIEDASMNYFVSKNLLDISNNITNIGKKQVLYTGPSSTFYKYNDKDRFKCRKFLSKEADYIIGFVGNLISIKNVMIIPDILFSLTQKIPEDKKIAFIIAGDGPLRNPFEKALKKKNIDYSFKGNILPTNIPNIMNGLDILILPSKNEGLPLVTLEALKCGTNVVGSMVGGIPEAIGDCNCFPLDDNFVENISSKIAEILINGEEPDPLDQRFSWDAAIDSEISLYNFLINKPCVSTKSCGRFM